jgi:hypothetical protein
MVVCDDLNSLGMLCFSWQQKTASGLCHVRCCYRRDTFDVARRKKNPIYRNYFEIMTKNKKQTKKKPIKQAYRVTTLTMKRQTHTAKA